MSKTTLPPGYGGNERQAARTRRDVNKMQRTSPVSRSVSDNNGVVRVRVGGFDTNADGVIDRYGIRVYDHTGAVAYDFTTVA